MPRSMGSTRILLAAEGRGSREGLHGEVFQEFLGLQLLIDVVLDEPGQDGLGLGQRLLRELQPVDLG